MLRLPNGLPINIQNLKVLVYDHNGEYVTEGTLPWPGYGFSLSFCNGMLWVSKDADASTYGGYGYWYGFKI